MEKLRNLLPSANTLFAFEAAARLNSFTLAAEELNVSQPAVSHAIKTLESSLGKPLFHRSHRRIELTAQGRQFYRDVTAGLEHIYYSANDLQLNKARETLTISGSTLFMQYWMLPRLQDFESKFPELNLRLHATDRDVSLQTEGIDISIRLGDGKWADYDVSLFADELVYPVCTPDYLEKNSKITSEIDLLNHQLLYVDEPFRIRMTWKDWFRDAGISEQNMPTNIPKGIIFNDAQLCIQAALSGAGVALGWHHISAPMIEKGDLIAPVKHRFAGQNAMYLITPREAQITLNTQKVRSWMLEEMANSLLP